MIEIEIPNLIIPKQTKVVRKQPSVKRTAIKKQPPKKAEEIPKRPRGRPPKNAKVNIVI
jgi:hypothetical protein